MHRTRADQPYVGIPTPSNDVHEIGIPGGKFLGQIDKYEFRPPRYYSKEALLLDFRLSTLLPTWTGPQNETIERAVLGMPLFDTRPWLRSDYNPAGNAEAMEIDTGFFDDAFEVFATFMVYPPSPGLRLRDMPGFTDLNVYAVRRGHPCDPAQARYFEERQDITLDFQQTANEAWRYTVRADALRFFSAALIFDKPVGAAVGAVEGALSFA